MSTTSDRLALLQRTKAGQRALLEEMYPDLDFSTVPFREYGRLFTGRKYVPGFVGGWKGYGRSNAEDPATREILPDYSGNGRDIKLYNFDFTESSGYSGGGLVSDGIDDYGQCIKGFSLPDDYTVVAIRRVIEGHAAALASKGSTRGAFLFEVLNNNKSGVVWSYGQTNSLTNAPDLLSYQSKASYNGQKILYGTAEDSIDDAFTIFGYSAANHMSAVLYDLRIYDHSLSAEELHLVRDEMMSDYEKATGGGIADIHYVADWDGKGRSNDEDEPMRSTWTDRATGKVIDLHNYAYAGMSGWGGYGIDCSKVVVNGPQDMVEGNVLQFNAIRNSANFLYPVSGMASVSVRIRVSGISRAVSEGVAFYLQIYFSSSDAPLLRITNDGVHEVDLPVTEGAQWMYLYVAPAVSAPDWLPIDPVTVEILPSYPGALVSDGIDDYGLTQEAIDENIGYILLHYKRLVENPDKWGYYMDNLYSSRLFIAYETGGNIATNLHGVTDDGEILTGKVGYTEPATEKLNIASNYESKEHGQIALYRIILIREQLDGAQVEFLKWKVEKEYRDWCRANGYEYTINQLTA